MHKNYKAAFLITLLMTTVASNVKADLSPEEELAVRVISGGVWILLGAGITHASESIIEESLRWAGEGYDPKSTDIDEDEALMTAMKVGLVSSAVTGCGYYYGFYRFFKFLGMQDGKAKREAIIIAIIYGIGSGIQVGQMTFAQLTGTYRAEKVQPRVLKILSVQQLEQWLKSIEENDLIAVDCVDDQDFLKFVRESSRADNSPFVVAHNTLHKLIEVLQKTRDSFTLDCGLTEYEEKDPEREARAEKRVDELLDLVNQRMVLIAQQPEYKEELARCGEQQEGEQAVSEVVQEVV